MHIVNEDVGAECVADDFVALELIERFTQGPGQLPDALLGDPGGVHLQEPLLHALGRASIYKTVSSTGSARVTPLSTPSRPAAIIAANARYVFDDGSGQRTSQRVPSIDLPGDTIGTRMSAERFVRPQVRYVGAS